MKTMKKYVITYELRGKRFLDVIEGYNISISKNVWSNLLKEISSTFKFLSINELKCKNIDLLRKYYN
jgi:hypothetical protein